MTAHYPAITAVTYPRNAYIWALVHDKDLKAAFLADRAGTVGASGAAAGVDEPTQAALVALDLDALLALGVHPMLCASLRGMTHSYENPDDYTYY